MQAVEDRRAANHLLGEAKMKVGEIGIVVERGIADPEKRVDLAGLVASALRVAQLLLPPVDLMMLGLSSRVSMHATVTPE
jgi:hypothetical protein